MAGAGDSPPAATLRPRGTRGAGLVAALAAIAPTFSPEARAEKRRLLAALEATSVTRPRALTKLHETLCFLQAYPDDREVLARVDRLLRGFPARVAVLAPGARRRLHDTGIAGSTVEYPFGLPLSRPRSG